MSLKRIKDYAWLPMLMVMFLGFMADRAGATIEAKNQPLPVENDLLQFRAGSHIMGFKPDKVYFVNTAGFLSVEFLGAHTVSPKAAIVDTSQPEKDVALTPDSGNTLANLQRVEYPGLWDGITLRYDAAKDGISESTYFIQPGADVADIQLRYNADTELQKDGALKIKLPSQQGYITESKPVAWQVIDGQKQPIQVAYEIKDGAIGFKTGEYNKDHELIIDPTYQWNTFYGSASEDYGHAIAVDGSGNVYVTGVSYATWGSPLHPYSSGTNSDIVVMKLDSTGALVWNTFYGFASDNYGLAIAVDGSGNVYVTGYSTDVSYDMRYGSHSNFVVMKLDSSGALVWNTFYGPGAYGSAIAVDGSGNIYIAGASQATWGSPLHAHSGGSDIVVMKLNSSGTLAWNTFYGSIKGPNSSSGIVVDGSGNIYIAGSSNATWGSPLHAFSGGVDFSDIVVMKLNSSGTLVWNTFYGTTGRDEGQGIAVDDGNVYVTGNSDVTWGNPLHAHSDGSNIVVMKLKSSGTLAWNTFYGSTDTANGPSGIAVDGSGNVYVTGKSRATWGSPLNAYTGGSDIVVMKLDSSGALAWNTFYGSASDDFGTGIAVNGSDNVYVTGQSYAAWGSPLHAHSGDGDIVVFKLIEDLNVPIIQTNFLPSINLLLLRKQNE